MALMGAAGFDKRLGGSGSGFRPEKVCSDPCRRALGPDRKTAGFRAAWRCDLGHSAKLQTC